MKSANCGEVNYATLAAAYRNLFLDFMFQSITIAHQIKSLLRTKAFICGAGSEKMDSNLQQNCNSNTVLSILTDDFKAKILLDEIRHMYTYIISCIVTIHLLLLFIY